MKHLPKTEHSMVHQVARDGKEYIITTSADRQRYTLYRSVEYGFEKVASANSPLKFSSVIDPVT